MSVVSRSPSRTSRWLDASVTYPLVAMTVALSGVLFGTLNRTIRYGRRPRLRQKLLIVSNHQSLIDSFLVGWALGTPTMFFRPSLIPYHLADARNFMSHPVLKHVYRALRVIPVDRNAAGERSDHGALLTAVRVLEAGGVVHAFIEGTRSVNGDLQPPKKQVGALALLSGAAVRLVHIDGMHAVQPYRKAPGDGPPTWIRRIFGARTEWLIEMRFGQEIRISVGDDMTPEEIKAIAGTSGTRHEQARRVSEAMMERLRFLQRLSA